MLSLLRVARWNIDFDQYINPYLIPLPTKRLPPLLGRFVGHRQKEPSPLGNVAVAVWSFIGALASLSLIYAVSGQLPNVEGRQAPRIIGSLGATAVLEFCAIDSPLAQPRNVILGQLMGSIIGTAISKGLTHSIPSRFEDLQWFAGALSCACTMVAMGLTRTVHPPAGATALLALTDDSVRQLGWMLVPVAMLSCALMLIVALLVNNIQRRFPLYWWSPDEMGAFWARYHGDESDDCEKAEVEAGSEAGQTGSVVEDPADPVEAGDHPMIIVTHHGLFSAAGVELRPEEKMCLESLRQRLGTVSRAGSR